jgi:hypothetical protein
METIKLYDLEINKFNNFDFEHIYNELVEFAVNPIFNNTFLLNTSSILNDGHNNYLEKFVFDTAIFHISEYNKKNNTNIDIRDIFVEFWSLDDIYFKKMHFDKDEQDYLINDNTKTYGKPFLSCITYLNDNNFAPTLITDIPRKFGSSEYSNFYTGKYTNFGMVFPRKMKQMSFDGGQYLHGMYLLDNRCTNRLVLPMNFWFKKPKYLSYFPYYIYLNRKYSKEKQFSIFKIQESVDFSENLFKYKKINIDNIVKTNDIVIDNNDIEKFNKWYKQLILGNSPVDFHHLIDLNDLSNPNNSYIYKFNFSFVL